MTPHSAWIATAVVALSVAAWPLSVPAQGIQPCGDLRNAFGPFDYRTASPRDKQLVEGSHFTPEIETLQRGISGTVGGEISYTLGAFPNHPRALLAMTRLSAKEKKEKPAGARYTVACYFDRAVRFTPDDPAVRVVFAHFLIDRGDQSAARQQLELVREKVRDNANLCYNVGLAYFDLKDYGLAREYAKLAYELGFPLQGLKKKLQQVKQWQD